MTEKKQRIIYLDDEEINLLLFKEMFKGDYDIYTTTSPDEAYRYLSANEVDYIFTDQMMPNKTGVEFLRDLASVEVKSEPKKVMVSGYTQEGEVSEALDQKLIDLFISKPWTYDYVKNQLSTIDRH